VLLEIIGLAPELKFRFLETDKNDKIWLVDNSNERERKNRNFAFRLF
jgi:hypothetical protein